jgi:hypothetical protein
MTPLQQALSKFKGPFSYYQFKIRDADGLPVADIFSLDHEIIGESVCDFLNSQLEISKPVISANLSKMK